MFFTNIFSFSSRRWVCEHAYQATRRELYFRREELALKFERHGIAFRTDILEEDRDLWSGVGLPELSVSVNIRPEIEPELGEALDESSLDSIVADDVLGDLDAALDRLENHVLEIN